MTDINPTISQEEDDENVVVDALTGEVSTLTAEEEAAEEARAAGISPELIHDPYGEEKLDTSKAEFEALLAEFSGDFQDFREGEIVKAQVLRVTDSAVILEFGFKSEGAVPREEFKEAPQVGEEIEVLLESLEDED
ncbi:MAG TPA: S1 RNA-binding domain-containing protein, partial [Longimicrobiales bacterium]|nr:S1 RNA-binding domain-containing protein [Longimicrobiales bacterium]